MKFILFISFLSILVCCKSVEQSQNNIDNSRLIKTDFDSWQHKDLTLDSIPGISLEKWYNENKLVKPKNKIIVAVLDTQIDLSHEALQNKIWVNKKEIPNNTIDDDNNGYIDDVNGWNFVGKGQKGYFSFGNFEYTRIVREDSLKKILINNQFDKTQLIKAIEVLKSNLSQYEQRYKNGLFLIENFESIKDSVQKVFKNNKYFENNLDSIL